MNQNDRKVILTRTDIVQQHKRDQLSECLQILVGTGIFVLLEALALWITLTNWYDFHWLICVGSVLMIGFFGVMAVLLAIETGKSGIRLWCLHSGNYAIEIDRVRLLECKTEEEYKVSRNGNGHTEIVTNQYVYFEKYGKVKSNRPLANGQECYLLVVLTKKPHVRGFWECDIHEIKGV